MRLCVTCRIYGIGTFPYAKYRVINLNMSQLNINQCDDDTDYIIWKPTDGVCICVLCVCVCVCVSEAINS